MPKKCPQCKSRAGYRAVQCHNCYAVYPWKAKDWAKDPPTCPKCKSTVSRVLGNFGDIQKKPPKKPEKEGEEGEGDEEE